MPRVPDPLSVPYEDAATGLVERAIKRATNRRVALRWAVGIVQMPNGFPGDWERLRLAFDRALYRAPQVYHRSESKTHSLKKPVWSAPLGRTREVRIRVFTARQGAAYVAEHPGSGLDLR